MRYNMLGHQKVSAIALGSMTWGQQNTPEDAFAQIDYALERGVNFIDTAELYPTPAKAETYSRTEQIIGEYFKNTPSKRHQIVLASKIAGKNPGLKWIRGGTTVFNRDHITQALHASLQRLHTDYIDLYQLHWPERRTNFFGRLDYPYDDHDDTTPLLETVQTLQNLVKQGKIKAWGVSNETPWGLMSYLQIAKQHDWHAPVSIQNPYSLLNRSFEIGLSEICHREGIGLLAYSPLAFGVLTGKYLKGERPPGSRIELFGGYFTRYLSNHAGKATEEYVKIARKYGLSPAQMALAFVNSRPFVTSNIIGATSLDQLKENIDSMDIELSSEVISKINNVHKNRPNPAP